MTRPQILLSVAALVLAVLLFQLPRSVVENEQLQEVADAETHGMEMPREVKDQLMELRSLIQTAENFDKKATFALSLAKAYLNYGVLDSAVILAERIEKWEEHPSSKAADIYFTAYERSGDAETGRLYAEKARELLRPLLEKDPEDVFLKNRLAMTLVASENPMLGINMLREIVAKDENNRQAILNLGLLSIQSGQFDRARERFEKLVSLDSTDHESKLYLAVSLMELAEKEEARTMLESILAVQDSIPAIKMMANDYLQTL